MSQGQEFEVSGHVTPTVKSRKNASMLTCLNSHFKSLLVVVFITVTVISKGEEKLEPGVGSPL